MQEDLNARQLDEIISGWADQVWDGQDWDDSRLKDYLIYDYWTPHVGLCTLSGFDYRCCNNGNNNAPAQFQFASSLSPSAFMSYKNENIAAEEELLMRMNDDIDRLRDFWENCGKNIEGASYAPADFIEWAFSINFYPDWLDWAIKNNLYASKKTGLTSGKDAPGTNSPQDPGKGDDTETTRRNRLYEEISEITNYKTIGKSAIRKILETYIGKTGSCIKTLNPTSISWIDWQGDNQVTTNDNLGKWLTRQK